MSTPESRASRPFRNRFSVILTIAVLFGSLGLNADSAERRIETARESFRSGGRAISVETFAPAGMERLPAVIILHSAAGTLLGKGEMVRFARALAARGKVAFLVRYFDRTGTVFADDRDIDQFTPVWIETTRHSVDFVAAHRRVQPGAIGIFGYSLGAYLAVAVSSLDSRVDAVVELAGGIFENFEPRMRRLPPSLILHGTADQRVPLSEAREVQRAGKRFGTTTEIQLYQGEGHRLSRAASMDATQRALRFLDRNLPSRQ